MELCRTEPSNTTGAMCKAQATRQEKPLASARVPAARPAAADAALRVRFHRHKAADRKSSGLMCKALAARQGQPGHERQ